MGVGLAAYHFSLLTLAHKMFAGIGLAMLAAVWTENVKPSLTLTNVQYLNK